MTPSLALGALALTLVIAAPTPGTSPKESAAMRLNDSTRPIADRVKAAQELGAAGDPKALDALLRGLEVRSEALHEAVVSALRKLGGASRLYEKLKAPREPLASKRLALRGVRALKPADAAPVLAELLDADEPELRADAALALAVVGAKEAEAALIRALDDSARNVRYHAAMALAEAGGDEALVAVKARRAKESDAVVKDALTQAVRRLSAK